MFPKWTVQLFSCRGERDCQDGRWLDLRGHLHWDSQGYWKWWDNAYYGGALVCPQARYNLISIRVLDEEECRIQVQKSVIIVSQGDMVILEGEKCESLYKLKEENSVRGGVLRVSLEWSSSQGGASRKTAMGHELGQSVVKRRKICIWVRPEIAQAWR